MTDNGKGTALPRMLTNGVRSDRVVSELLPGWSSPTDPCERRTPSVELTLAGRRKLRAPSRSS